VGAGAGRGLTSEEDAEVPARVVEGEDDEMGETNGVAVAEREEEGVDGAKGDR
jgi:hypothetical protein